MEVHRTSRVFVPGGMPRLTYNPRSERKLEERLGLAQDNLCKLVTVTGPTKSGKTVLTKTVFPKEDNIWVDGGTVQTEEDFWSLLLEELDIYTDSSIQSTSSGKTTVSGKGDVTAGLPLFATVKGELGGAYARGQEETKTNSRSVASRAAVVRKLQSTNRPLIIDDFHYLDRSTQGALIRALKPLIFDGLPVILIAIPHRRYDAIKVEREMTGRLENISIPPWDKDELNSISREGFPLLNLEIAYPVTARFSTEAYGSPHLMQEFCRHLCSMHSIEETQSQKYSITTITDKLFRNVAEDTGKVIFDRLARGPSQRADRIKRKLKTGEEVDIYKVVLNALANMAPGLEMIGYEELRLEIREILSEKIPQAHEVSRVLEKMSEIATSDETSTPVLDWEKEEQKLHITDPFFAFFLKWGVET